LIWQVKLSLRNLGGLQYLGGRARNAHHRRHVPLAVIAVVRNSSRFFCRAVRKPGSATDRPSIVETSSSFIGSTCFAFSLRRSMKSRIAVLGVDDGDVLARRRCQRLLQVFTHRHVDRDSGLVPRVAGFVVDLGHCWIRPHSYRER
jgi:hypothetical protein